MGRAEPASRGFSTSASASSQKGLVSGVHLEDEGGPLLYLQRAQPSLPSVEYSIEPALGTYSGCPSRWSSPFHPPHVANPHFNTMGHLYIPEAPRGCCGTHTQGRVSWAPRGCCGVFFIKFYFFILSFIFLSFMYFLSLFFNLIFLEQV